MFDIPAVAILIGLAAASGWSAGRAWRSGRPALRWAGTLASGFVALAAAAVLAVALVGYYKLNRRYDNPVAPISIELTPERVARGERFAMLCAGCHAADRAPPLEGQNFLGGEAPPVGTLWAPNLTPTHLAEWSDGEIIRAIREGIHRNGRSLLVMPSKILSKLSDADLRAIVAYLRSQPPIEPDSPPTSLNVLGALLIAWTPALEAQPPITEPVVAPPPGPTRAYGEYLTSIACAGCHGADLGGDARFRAPGLAGAGLGWTEEQFLTFMRSGVRPDGRAVDAERMPWENLSKLLVDDDDLKAVFARLTALGG